MIPYLKLLLFDKGAFVGFVRSGLTVLGLGIMSGYVPFPAGWEFLGLVSAGAAQLMRSSVQVPLDKKE
jgi:hypothetical protein